MFLILLPAGTSVVFPVGYMDQSTGLLHISPQEVTVKVDIFALLNFRASSPIWQFRADKFSRT